jgi:hypothetical protein
MLTHRDAPELDLLTLYGSRAPSPCDLKPWRFRIVEGSEELGSADLHPTDQSSSAERMRSAASTRRGAALELVADAGHAPAQSEAAMREVILSCGAALLNMRLALRHFGRRDDVQLLPDPEDPSIVARIRAGRHAAETPRDRELFYAIERRHTVHGALGGTVTAALVEQCRTEAQIYGAWLHCISAPADRQSIGDLVFEAHVAATDADDLPACDDWHGTTLREAALVRGMVQQAPVLMLLGTYGDDPAHWVVAGEALEAVLLCAAAHGVFAAFANQPLRVPTLRPWVSAVAGHRGSPHVLFGLGHAGAAAH